ncbi:hypothetical protein NIES4071_77770 [Calothrix sp. NIES-4071]|nr:hypothetical protein NIES4071_77770 [Calothrix sp. NIES-4071]BAZ62050.1 hypothetical protein NIES4105_77710 [Calothrix sp. NIES-4105]
MEAFAFIPPEWTNEAIHAYDFCCPKCHSSSLEATKVWINRRAPVTTENYRRKWQEFYKCQCGGVWWAWSNDRPPTNLKKPDELNEL